MTVLLQLNSYICDLVSLFYNKQILAGYLIPKPSLKISNETN